MFNTTNFLFHIQIFQVVNLLLCAKILLTTPDCGLDVLLYPTHNFVSWSFCHCVACFTILANPFTDFMFVNKYIEKVLISKITTNPF